MGLKINGTTIINDDRYFNNINSADTTTTATLIQAVKTFDHKLITQNSAGTTMKTYYGANTA